MTNIPTTSPDYSDWLSEVKSRVRSARLSAGRSMNREMILLYWDIGRGIVEKQEELGWGKSVVESLSQDLKVEFPATTGFSPDNLWRMRQFYIEYSSSEFLAQANEALGRLKISEFLEQAVPELRDDVTVEVLEHIVPENVVRVVRELAALVPWGHHLEIMKKVAEPAGRLFYFLTTTRLGWTRKILLNQIKARAYERCLPSGKSHNFPLALPEHLAEQAEEMLKSSYNLEFLGISREIRERELEGRLIERLKDFILEPGPNEHKTVQGQIQDQ